MTVCDLGLDPGWEKPDVNDIIGTTGENWIWTVYFIKCYM